MTTSEEYLEHLAAELKDVAEMGMTPSEEYLEHLAATLKNVAEEYRALAAANARVAELEASVQRQVERAKAAWVAESAANARVAELERENANAWHLRDEAEQRVNAANARVAELERLNTDIRGAWISANNRALEANARVAELEARIRELETPMAWKIERDAANARADAAERERRVWATQAQEQRRAKESAESEAASLRADLATALEYANKYTDQNAALRAKVERMRNTLHSSTWFLAGKRVLECCPECEQVEAKK